MCVCLSPTCHFYILLFSPYFVLFNQGISFLPLKVYFTCVGGVLTHQIILDAKLPEPPQKSCHGLNEQPSTPYSTVLASRPWLAMAGHWATHLFNWAANSIFCRLCILLFLPSITAWKRGGKPPGTSQVSPCMWKGTTNVWKSASGSSW